MREHDKRNYDNQIKIPELGFNRLIISSHKI